MQSSEISFSTLIASQNYFPSPIAWEDQVFYFLMLDRFSDGKENGFKDQVGNLVREGTTPLHTPDDASNAIKTEDEARKWREAGTRYVGGNLQGLTQKIGYLRRLGVTAIWISPIFKQVAFQETYHGYGIQDFLEVEPHFGTREDLKELVRVAHENGIYVILDIILNHSGNVFSYEPDRYWTEGEDGNWFLDPRWDGAPYEVKGFNFFKDPTAPAENLPFIKTDPNNPASWPKPDAAIWPVEFQDPACFTQKGRISNWDYDPEFRSSSTDGLSKPGSITAIAIARAPDGITNSGLAILNQMGQCLPPSSLIWRVPFPECLELYVTTVFVGPTICLI
jgi:hypothetical protein